MQVRIHTPSILTSIHALVFLSMIYRSVSILVFLYDLYYLHFWDEEAVLTPHKKCNHHFCVCPILAIWASLHLRSSSFPCNQKRQSATTAHTATTATGAQSSVPCGAEPVGVQEIVEPRTTMAHSARASPVLTPAPWNRSARSAALRWVRPPTRAASGVGQRRPEPPNLHRRRAQRCRAPCLQRGEPLYTV